MVAKNILQDLIWDFELHDLVAIEKKLKDGVNPNDEFEGRSLGDHLILMYTRGPKFKKCFKILLDYGLEYPDEALKSVLLDDGILLKALLEKDKNLAARLFSLPCAFTSLNEVSLLHICAEYNHIECAQVLLDHDADVNKKSGLDENGFGGQTPIFHTVTQYRNICKEMMILLLDNQADLSYTVKAIHWGKNMPWETLIPSVNPISYAMMGRLFQLHRKEEVVAEIIETLMMYLHGNKVKLPNIPNQYLAGKTS